MLSFPPYLLALSGGQEPSSREREDSQTPVSAQTNVLGMAQFDVDKMIERFEQRAAAVKDRPLPPVAGEERKRFVEQAESDYTDFLLISKASWSVEDGSLVLTIPLKIPD
jgi:hypothetical protein